MEQTVTTAEALARFRGAFRFERGEVARRSHLDGRKRAVTPYADPRAYTDR